MSEFEALLVLERGPTPSQRFPLQSEQITIGRSAGNDLVVADPEVSRRHIRVVRRADGFAVEDIGSTNGTFVNGQRISHLTLLQDGDTIDLGDTVRLRFLSQVVAPPGPAAPPSPMLEAVERPTLNSVSSVAPPVALPPAAVPNAWPPREAVYRPAAPAAETPPAAVPAPPPRPAYPPSLPPAYVAPRRGRGLLLGCGLLVALLLVCAGTFLVLDTYDQGRLLYCGALRPVFQFVLGVFGFAPLCP